MPAADREFRGDAGALVVRMFLAVLTFALAASVPLAGSAWPSFWLFSGAVLAPFVALFYLPLRAGDRCRFDDERREIRIPLRRPIPYEYERLRRVRLFRFAGMCQVSTRRGLAPETILFGLSPRDERRLLGALHARCPDLHVRQSNLSIWMFVVAPIAVLALDAAAVRSFSELSAAARLACAEGRIVELTDGETAELGGAQVAAPPGFELIDSEGGLTFRTPDGAGALRYEALDFDQAVSGSARGLLARYALGFGSYFDALQWAACAEYGSVPLLVKSVLLYTTAGAAKLDSARASWRITRTPESIALVASDPQAAGVSILVKNSAGSEIFIAGRFTSPLSDELTAQIVAGVSGPANRRPQAP